MNPFFFGPSEHQLYGVYHPAVAARPKKQGVLLCYPFGQEYMRAHRAFRQIAMLLAKKGFHVLRFDYRGTGDSSCDMEDVKADDWLADIDIAIEELKDMSGVEEIALIGLRLGGLLAATVSTRRQDVSSLVVWDSINSGKEYENELRDEINNRDEVVDLDQDNFIDASGVIHFNGFPLTPHFLAGLGSLDLLQSMPAAEKILQVVSNENNRFEQLKNAWSKLNAYEYDHAESPGDWNYVDDYGGVLLPQPVIKSIVDWL